LVVSMLRQDFCRVAGCKSVDYTGILRVRVLPATLVQYMVPIAAPTCAYTHAPLAHFANVVHNQLNHTNDAAL